MQEKLRRFSDLLEAADHTRRVAQNYLQTRIDVDSLSDPHSDGAVTRPEEVHLVAAADRIVSRADSTRRRMEEECQSFLLSSTLPASSSSSGGGDGESRHHRHRLEVQIVQDHLEDLSERMRTLGAVMLCRTPPSSSSSSSSRGLLHEHEGEGGGEGSSNSSSVRTVKFAVTSRYVLLPFCESTIDHSVIRRDHTA